MGATGMSSDLHPAFQHQQYLFRRKLFKLFGGAFHVYDERGGLVFYSEQRAFRLREDFSIYADEHKRQELLRIKTPQILDFGATYYVHDSTVGESVGALRRRGMRSIFRDRWDLLNSEEQETGRIEETHMLGALFSRLSPLIPQSYQVSSTSGTVAEIRQHFNPFILKYTLSITRTDPLIDRRLLVAAGILLAAIERRNR